MRARAARCLLLAGVLAFGACGDDSGGGGGNNGPDGGQGNCSGDFAPQSLVGYKIEFAEEGGPRNTWTFRDETTALLDDIASSYTYEVQDACHTVVEFDVGGTDRYEMEWTSPSGGTCTESYEGQDPVPCTFAVVR